MLEPPTPSLSLERRARKYVTQTRAPRHITGLPDASDTCREYLVENLGGFWPLEGDATLGDRKPRCPIVVLLRPVRSVDIVQTLDTTESQLLCQSLLTSGLAVVTSICDFAPARGGAAGKLSAEASKHLW